MSTPPPLLRFEQLRITAADSGVPVVDGVSLTVQRGEVLALIGESGSGKTTLALGALGRIRPGLVVSGGGIQLDGADLVAASPRALQRLRGRAVSYVAQSASQSFNQRMRLDAQVCEPALVHAALPAATALRRAHALYQSLDLPQPQAIGERYPHEVSGGQLQRFMIAMGLLLGPQLLVCDEPTSALDVMTQIEVLRALKAAIANQQTAALFVSHDLAVVAQVADRIAVLRRGRVVECGPAADILDRPQAAYTRELIAACRRWPPAPHPRARSAQASGEVLLELEGVAAGYGRGRSGRPAVTVIDGVSLRLARGEVLAVVGESGSGKSTLARVIAGLHPPFAGTVRLAGQELAPALEHRTRQQLRNIQIVFQSADTALNSRHSVGRILGRVLDFHGQVPRDRQAARVAELLAMVQLPRGYAQRRPAQLSGGEKQRVNLARALAAEPQVLICDEITSALDTVITQSIVALVEDLRDRLALGIVFISHDLATVASLADRILVLERGHRVEEGPTDRVLTKPEAAYTQQLLRSVPQLRPGWLEEAYAAHASAHEPDPERALPQ